MRQKVAWQIGVYVLLMGIFIYLLNTHGSIKTYLSKNVSFLILPLILFLSIELVARLAAIAFRLNERGKVLYITLSGVAWGCLLYCLFDRVAALYSVLAHSSESSFVNEITSYLPAIKNMNVFMVILVMGITIFRLSPALERIKPGWQIKQAIQASGLVAAGFALWGMVYQFHGFWHPLNQAAWIPFVGCALVAISRLSSYGSAGSSRALSDFCTWFQGATAQILVICILLGMYLAIIRPECIDRYRYAPLVDWGIVIVVVCYAYFGASSGLGAAFTSPLVVEPWRKHMQQVDTKTGWEFKRLVILQKRFVEEGEKGPLLVHLAILLGDNNWPEDRIYMQLQPLIEHKDIMPSWFSLSWKKKRIKKENQEIRKKLMNEVVSRLDPENMRTEKIGHRRIR